LSGDLLALASALCFSLANITIAKGAARGDEDNGVFVSLLLTTLIAGGIWLALGLARGFVPVTPAALAWFAGAGVLTGFVGRVFGYATVQRLGAMRASAIKRLQPFFAVALGLGVLGERLGGSALAGMALILGSFAVLVARPGARRGESGRDRSGRLDVGYLYGPVSALGYSAGYVLRKMGLAEAPDAYLGAAVGTLVGAALFALAGAWSTRYAAAVRETFRRPRPWLIAAGVLSSAGQILYFLALERSSVSRVALLVSLEVFMTIFLSVLFLRREEQLTAAVALAAALGFAGAALVISG
jgi:drug/metabolite transporter (DMT)-like permease